MRRNGTDGEQGEAEILPVTHRPGALVIQGPQVSLTQGRYRILIDLPTHHYEEEIEAMGQCQIKSIEAATKIRSPPGSLCRRNRKPRETTADTAVQ